jgi:hypothetical protein
VPWWLAVESSDQAAQLITPPLEVLAVDAVVRVANFGRQMFERGVQDLPEQFNIIVGQIELHWGPPVQ